MRVYALKFFPLIPRCLFNVLHLECDRCPKIFAQEIQHCENVLFMFWKRVLNRSLLKEINKSESISKILNDFN